MFPEVVVTALHSRECEQSITTSVPRVLNLANSPDLAALVDHLAEYPRAFAARDVKG